MESFLGRKKVRMETGDSNKLLPRGQSKAQEGSILQLYHEVSYSSTVYTVSLPFAWVLWVQPTLDGKNLKKKFQKIPKGKLEFAATSTIYIAFTLLLTTVYMTFSLYWVL